MKQFIIGEEYICSCGRCLPFIVVKQSSSILIGVMEDGDECVYTPEDYPKIRPVTKLDKVLK